MASHNTIANADAASRLARDSIESISESSKSIRRSSWRCVRAATPAASFFDHVRRQFFRLSGAHVLRAVDDTGEE
jgi:hypothetical protein